MDSSAAGLPLYSRRGILYRRWAEGLPAPMFYLPRRGADPLAHAALGRNSALHARTGLLSQARGPSRRQSAPAERVGSEQWLDRLFLTRWQDDSGNGL